MADPSPPTGLFLVYEPKDQEPAVDIVIIHGLKGHAYKTWTSPLMPDAVVDLQSDGEMMASRRGQVLRSVTGLMKRASGKRGPSSAPKPKTPVSTLFWPRDLLPEDCPNARILTYGYDTKITKYTSGSTNKNSVFSHSKDFLFALGRSHTKDRPLIFLAHSLGGIVVKEMLALSSTSPTDELCNIVSSTVAVIFLGTPHRGSPDLSALGAWAKSVLSGLRFQTNSAILDTLGLKTTDLERSQEAFSGLWFKHGFRVKTFQEGYPMTKINLGVLGNKVVPDTSSLIGDQREHAETLQANHMEMCRFSGREDPNFVKVVGELRSAYRTILTGTIDDPCTDQPVAVNSGMFNATSGQELTAQQAACLKSIQFSHMHRPRQLIEDPAPQTGHWLIKNETYSHWLLDRDLKERPCILWIKGKPGAGKSTIMKQAFRHAKFSLSGSEYCVAGVFVSAKGEPLEHSSIGIFRSLLHQLLPHYPVQLQEAVQIWTELDEEAIMSRRAEVIWREPVLKSLLNSILDYTSGKRTTIFIDGLDELDLPLVGSHVEFWGHLLTGENNGRVRVCLSSRHHPQTSLRSASELIAEDLNESDISTYVNQRLKARISRSESHWEPKLRNKMIDNARGIFLWVTLTMDSLLAKYDQGESLELLLRHIDSMPWELEHLFTNMVMSIRPESRRVALRVFQWALMSTAPLRLHQWHHVLAFIREPVPDSLKEWRRSVHYTESDSQLEREIKALSGGLLEVSASRPDEAPLEDEGNLSIRAGAGSLDLEQGETRIVKVIHQSVSEFFLEGGGFRLLDASAARNPVGSCHVTIAITCFNYISIQELDKLIDARRTYQKQESVSLSEWELSETSPVDSENESFLALEERNLAQDTTNSRRKTFDEHLIMIPTAETHTTVASWIAAGNIPTNPTTEAAPPIQYANSLLSSEYVSHQLEAWPSLLFYILSSLPTHLKVAKDVTSHSSTLFKCLDNTELWDRFVLLKEDIPRGTTFSEFINPRSRLIKALEARARRFEISRRPSEQCCKFRVC
ncbi:uncharacterized protein NECHADRAFT_96544 [Fusarium vanettenii 77-13-4]|uniref:Nephrocystin 3-like N-terminal domain-containing protein n=1 Tax=Fusarium vanettenii (strain ATCC MYA-4622 / CBS 123669 / FGSC 9596 / NRRL 45880 / 77-13-4) TaxID=660122 RepID=C7ZJ60_FUSV7|nr:uncharacterized protein NECHADRAFT_96544 [Fusarium vanettenii 77-13-4]EEU35959.1 hypothetical protein NECHADRAFT_96544 [Fusarium vanettenii 77-13-4]